MSEDQQSNMWVAFGVFIAFLVLYLATPTSNYTFDALNYATSIRYADMAGPKALLHPHHLAFNSLGYVTWHTMRTFSPQVQSIVALQVMNSLFGALGLAFCYLVISNVIAATAGEISSSKRSLVAVVSTAVLGLSFGWWTASTDGRANIPAMAAIFPAFFFAWRTARVGGARNTAAVGALTAMAALLHQSHGMFVLVGAAGVMLAPVDVKRKLGLASALAGAFFVALGVPYLVALEVRGIHTFDAAQKWMLAYAHEGTWWSFDIPGNLGKDALALAHAFVTTSAISSEVTRVVFALCAGLVIGSALAREALRVGRRGAITDIEGAKAGSGAANKTNPLFAFNALTVVWIVLYGAFFTVWAPGYFAFWIPVASAIVMVLAVNSVHINRVVPVASAIAIVLGAVNFTQYVLPHMPERSNKSVTIARAVALNTPRGSFVVVSGMGYLAQMEVYVPYFANRRVISLNQVMGRHGARGIEALRADIRSRLDAGTGVYVLEDVTEPGEAWRQLGRRYGIDREQVWRAFAGFQLTPTFLAGNQHVYVLKRASGKDALDPQQ